MTERIEYRFFFKSTDIAADCPFYTPDGNGEVRVYPQYDDDIHIEYKAEEDKKFMRRMLGNELTFVNIPKDDIYDYQCIMNHDCDDEITFIIRRSCDDFAAIWWQGYFGKNDGEIDEDECTFTVRPTVDDDYNCLLTKGDEIFNILNVLQEHDVEADMSYYEYAFCEDETVALYTPNTAPTHGFTDAAGVFTFCDVANPPWSGPENRPYGGKISDDVPNTPIAPNWNRNVNACGCLPDQGRSVAEGSVGRDRGFVVYRTDIEVDLTGFGSPRNFRITTTWFREVVWTIDIDGNPTLPDGPGWGAGGDHIDAGIVDGVQMHKWGREPDANPDSFNPSRWTTDNPGALPTFWQYTIADLPDFSETFEHNRLIEDVIDYFMDQLGCGLAYVSTFFQNDALPAEAPADITAYIAANPTHNYACEEVNRLNYLMIAQKSDTIIINATQQATLGMLSFNELIKILFNIFNIFWYIDSNGDFRIEHASFFAKAVGAIDLTDPVYTNEYTQNLWIFRTNKYSFTKDKMPGLERWTFMEQHYEDFIGEPITYDRILSNTRIEQIEKEYHILNVTTDIMYIYQVGLGNLDGPISTDGFTIMQTYLDTGVYYLENEAGILSGVSLPNNHLSVANLQDRYWRHERVLIEGRMNREDEIFDSAIRTKKQIPIEFPLCCDAFNELALIITQIGNGEIIAARFYILTGIIEIELLYDDEC